MRAATILLSACVIACAPTADQADSETLQAIDTVKAATAVVATDSIARTDTASPRTDSAPRPAASKTTSKTTSTVTPPRSKSGDSIIGRDSVIPLDPKKPRLPIKKPPST